MAKIPPLPLSVPQRPPARFSRQPLPPYRHVPGLTPHPVKDPKGHLYGIEESGPSAACRSLPDHWFECAEYLFGVDLFNRAYLWEAHEVWEMVWIAAGKTTEPAGFVQSLIQTSAALLRLHLGTPRGAHNLWARARERLEAIEVRASASRGQASYMGISVGPWSRSVESHLEVGGGGPYPFLILAGGPP